LVAEQNDEFERTREQAIAAANSTAAKQAAAEEVRLKELAMEESRAEKLRAQIRARAAQIPPEPASGVTIALCFPDGKRVTRRFATNDSADHVFAFVANSDAMFDDKGRPFNFELQNGPMRSQQLQRGHTLVEQGMKGRTLLHVLIDD
jgi:hypothetical protein